MENFCNKCGFDLITEDNTNVVTIKDASYKFCSDCNKILQYLLYRADNKIIISFIKN